MNNRHTTTVPRSAGNATLNAKTRIRSLANQIKLRIVRIIVIVVLVEVEDVSSGVDTTPGESIIPVMLVDVWLGVGAGAGEPGESIIPANAEPARAAVRIAAAPIRRSLFTIL